MASLGQYQSFALIAYDAIRRQADNVACCRNNGDNVSTQMSLLYTAKKLADVVLSYSTGSLSSATPRYVAKTAPIGTPVTVVNQYGNWDGIITIFDPSLTIVLTLFVPADLLGNKDAVVNYWNEEYPDSGWVMGYEIVQYAIAPNVDQFVYTMTSPLGYGQDYTGYSFEFLQYEGGIDAGQSSPLAFGTSGLSTLLPSSGKIQFYENVILYEDLSFVNYNSLQDIIDTIFTNTGFTFTPSTFGPINYFIVESPLNSFDYFNGVNIEFKYYVDPASPPLSPADFTEVFGLTLPVGVAPTQETYSGSFSKSPIYPAKTENDIIAICNWLQRSLLFSSTTIPSLASTTLNG